jgi:hypothetical protein
VRVLFFERVRKAFGFPNRFINFFSLREKVTKRGKNLAGLSLNSAENYGKNRSPK